MSLSDFGVWCREHGMTLQMQYAADKEALLTMPLEKLGTRRLSLTNGAGTLAWVQYPNAVPYEQWAIRWLRKQALEYAGN